MIYCHPIRPEKIGQFNVNLRVKLSGVLLLTPTITPYVLPLKLFLYYFKSKTTFLYPWQSLSLGRIDDLVI